MVGVEYMSEVELTEGYDMMRQTWKVMLRFVEDRVECIYIGL